MRGLTKDTILNHLVKCQDEGKNVLWNDLVEKDIEKQVLDVINEVGSEHLKPIKEKLPEEISYYDIKLVLYKIAYS